MHLCEQIIAVSTNSMYVAFAGYQLLRSSCRSETFAITLSLRTLFHTPLDTTVNYLSSPYQRSKQILSKAPILLLHLPQKYYLKTLSIFPRCVAMNYFYGLNVS